MRVLITGAGGHLGGLFSKFLGICGIAKTRQELDVVNFSKVVKTIKDLKPTAVINCAGITDLERAEESGSLLNLVNAKAPGVMAEACKDLNIPFIHFTDPNVFDGKTEEPMDETTELYPLNALGRSKRLAEKNILHVDGKFLIVRTNWLYSWWGKNLFTLLMARGMKSGRVEMVLDQRGSPTYAPHLVWSLILYLQNLWKKPFQSGIYNITNEGVTSHFGLCRSIFAHASYNGIENVGSLKEASISVRYPKNALLNCKLAKKKLNISLPQWCIGLQVCMSRHLQKDPPQLPVIWQN